MSADRAAYIKNLIQVAVDEVPWTIGALHKRARQAQGELVDRDFSESISVIQSVDAVLDLLESPIEQVALYHMLGRNYSPFPNGKASFALAYRSLPEKWPEDLVVAIVPQVEVGRYRADFMVHLRNGAKFVVECDGKEFHTGSADGFRDSSLLRHFKIPVIRFTGSQIWESPLWTNDVRKMVFMLSGLRNVEGR